MRARVAITRAPGRKGEQVTELQQYLAEEVAEDHADGIITRREAMRRLGLLGVAGSAAAGMLGAAASEAAAKKGGRARGRRATAAAAAAAKPRTGRRSPPRRSPSPARAAR